MKETGLSRVSKNLVIAEIEKEIKKRSGFFVTKHSRVAAIAMDKLRVKLRKVDSRYLAVKGSLARKALKNTGLETLTDKFAGASGIAFTGADPVASSKVLVEFSKQNENFKLEAGFVNGQVISLEQIKVLANLPSREVLISRVLGAMQAPVSRFVGVLAGTLRKMVTVLDAVAKKKGGA